MSISEAWARAVARRLPGTVVRGAASDPTVWLSFDDGPCPPHTGALLDALARAQAPAVFCVIGALAERHPDLVHRAVAEGHGLVNHGYGHLAVAEADADGYVADVERGHQVLERILGRRLDRWFRPPYGTVGARAGAALARAGFRLLLWSHDSEDWRLDCARQLMERFDADQLRAGDVVLLHDDTASIPDTVPELVARLRGAGFRIGTPGELLSPVTRPAPGPWASGRRVPVPLSSRGGR